MEKTWTMEINALNESSAQFCMICLDMHSKLYPSNQHNLDMKYQSLTGILLADAFFFTPMFCSECAQRLKNCCKFRDKTLRAYQLLSELVQSNAVLSLQTLSSVDRARCQLTSSVVKKTFEPDHCDLYVTEDTGIDKVNVKNEKKDLHEKLLYLKCETDCDLELESGDICDDAAEFTAGDDNTNVEITNDDVKYDINVVYVEQNNTNVKRHEDQPKILNHKITTDITNAEAEWLNDMDDNIDIDFDMDEDMQQVADDVKRRDENVKMPTYATINNTVSQNNVKHIRETDKQSVSNESLATSHAVVKKRAAKRKQPPSDERKRPRKGNRKKISLPPQKKEEQKYKDIKWFRRIQRSPEEQVADWAKRQESEKYKEARYKCTDCYKHFRVEKTYKLHMEKHTDKYGAFECPICRIRLSSRCLRTDHHLSAHKFIYRCTACAFVTNSNHTAHNHSHWHDGKTYECSDCGKVFTKRSSYYGHVRLAHPSDTVCALCGYSFVSKRGLWMHQKQGHRDDTQELSGPQCSQCNVRFASEAAYDTHLQVSPKHGAPGDLKRNDPSYATLGKPELSSEDGTSMRRQSIVNCELCSAVLENRHKYNWHLRRDHPESVKAKGDFMCEQCGKFYPTNFHLQDHMLRHGSPKLKCDVCDRKFYSPNLLKLHVLRIHDAAQRRDKYACAHCAYKSKERSNFERHMKTHLDSNLRRWFHCTLCETKTTTSQALKAHMLHVHEKVPLARQSARLTTTRGRSAHSRHRLGSHESMPQNYGV